MNLSYRKRNIKLRFPFKLSGVKRLGHHFFKLAIEFRFCFGVDLFLFTQNNYLLLLLIASRFCFFWAAFLFVGVLQFVSNKKW